MRVKDYKAALKDIIEATDDEAILQRWKVLLEKDFEQYRQQHSADQSPSSATDSNEGREDSGYSILESGLGIDE